MEDSISLAEVKVFNHHKLPLNVRHISKRSA